MKRVRLILLIIFSTGVLNTAVYSQDRPEHELHSMMIYNFLKYIQWPGNQNTGDFVIGVLKDDNVYGTLNTWYGNKERGGKKFIIKKISSLAEASSCQLVYVGTAGSNQFEDLLTTLGGNSTLTVTNKRGLGAKGSCINFKVIDGRLKFEMNQAAIANAKLRTSSQLTSMAILI